MQRIVFAHVHVFTWVKLRATLFQNDIACEGALATVKFHAKSFRITVTAVLGGAFPFFMCHFLMDFFVFFKIAKTKLKPVCWRCWMQSVFLERDSLNFDLGKLLTVAIFFAVALAALLFEYNDLVALDER